MHKRYQKKKTCRFVARYAKEIHIYNENTFTFAEDWLKNI